MTTAAEDMDSARLQRLHEAADWLLRLQGAEHTETEINEWLRWCDADPNNIPAFEQLQQDWQELDVLKTGRIGSSRRAGLPLRGGARKAWLIAASLALIAFAGLVAQRVWMTPPQPQMVAAVANRSATLPDGSKIILGARTQVNVDFNGGKRRLELSSGSAYFKVKHDTQHPFVVQAGEVSVTAIGTAFDVRRQDGRITVTVEEGVVEVVGNAPGNKGKPVVWRAEAGYQVVYSSAKRTASIASINPAAALAWRNGELAYVGEPLGSVIDDLNRYSARKIIVADPKIAEFNYTGTAFAASLDDWLNAVSQAYGVDVRESANGDIILSIAK